MTQLPIFAPAPPPIPPSNPPLTAKGALSRCGVILDARGVQRDSANGERSMAKAVEVYNALYGTSLTETQGWMFMTILKIVRSTKGSFDEDNYLDGINYLALAAEAAAARSKS